MQSLREASLRFLKKSGRMNVSIYNINLLLNDAVNSSSFTLGQKEFLRDLQSRFPDPLKFKNKKFVSELIILLEKNLAPIRAAQKFRHPLHENPLQDYEDILNVVLNFVKKAKELHEMTKVVNVKNFLKNHYKFYKLTVENFHGTVMLPVCQSLDVNMGPTPGHCFAMDMEWMNLMLHHQNPFGIDPERPPPFKIVNPESKAGSKYFDINHLAFLNERIALFQNLEAFTMDEFSKLRSNPKVEKMLPHLQFAQRFRLFKSFQDLVISLISEAKKNLDCCYRLTITEAERYGSKTFAHETCFKINSDGSCHYFDSNCGWFRFDKISDFQKWLAFQLNFFYPNLTAFAITRCSTLPESQIKSSCPGKSASMGDLFKIKMFSFVKSAKSELKLPAKTRDFIDDETKHAKDDIDVEKKSKKHERRDKVDDISVQYGKKA